MQSLIIYLENSKLIHQNELDSFKEDLPDWTFEAKRIWRQLKFKDFVDAFGFLTKIALISETMNHHPNLQIIYANLTIELTTHDKEGITNLDIELAKKINQLKKLELKSI